VVKKIVEPAVHVIHNFQDSVPLDEAATIQNSKFESTLQPFNRLYRPQRGFKIAGVAYSEDKKSTL
jgi:hypothetical protein